MPKNEFEEMPREDLLKKKAELEAALNDLQLETTQTAGDRANSARSRAASIKTKLGFIPKELTIRKNRIKEILELLSNLSAAVEKREPLRAKALSDLEQDVLFVQDAIKAVLADPFSITSKKTEARLQQIQGKGLELDKHSGIFTKDEIKKLQEVISSELDNFNTARVLAEQVRQHPIIKFLTQAPFSNLLQEFASELLKLRTEIIITPDDKNDSFLSYLSKRLDSIRPEERRYYNWLKALRDFGFKANSLEELDTKFLELQTQINLYHISRDSFIEWEDQFRRSNSIFLFSETTQAATTNHKPNLINTFAAQLAQYAYGSRSEKSIDKELKSLTTLVNQVLDLKLVDEEEKAALKKAFKEASSNYSVGLIPQDSPPTPTRPKGPDRRAQSF